MYVQLPTILLHIKIHYNIIKFQLVLVNVFIVGTDDKIIGNNIIVIQNIHMLKI